jgi:ribonucleoside-diphosphate reductase alpha chain
MEIQITDPLFIELGEQEGFLTQELLSSLGEGLKLQDLPQIPEMVKKLFVTTFEIPPIWHIKIQSAFQEYTDNAVSKTINFPHDATKEEVREAFLMAHQERCKGITVYRSGSRSKQVLACGTKQVC